MTSQRNSTKHLKKRVNTQSPQTIQKKEEEGALPNSLYFQHNIRNHSHSNQTRKQDIQIGTKKIKLALLAGGMKLYLENPKESTTINNQ